MEKITDQQREQLRKPLPAEAISQHPTKTFLSSIKAIYVTERLNDVFGIGSWRTKTEYITHEDSKPDKNGFVSKMVVVKLTFKIPAYDIYYECFGGNDNADLGDAYKGATTDALTKVGSFLEIGIDVFKGKATTPSVQPQNAPQRTQTQNTTQSTQKCEKCGADKVNNPKTGKWFCKEKCWLKNDNVINVEEIPFD